MYAAPYYYSPYMYGFYTPYPYVYGPYRYYYNPYGFYYNPYSYWWYYTYSPYPYYYYYGPGVIRYPASLVVVQRRYYGCYHCAASTCTTGDSRDGCEAASVYDVPTDLDRYELTGQGSSFITPGEDGAWPLWVVIHNVTVFDPTPAGESAAVTPGGVPVLINFYTEGGSSEATAGTALMATGWTLFAISLCGICCGWSQYRKASRPSGGGGLTWENKFRSW